MLSVPNSYSMTAAVRRAGTAKYWLAKYWLTIKLTNTLRLKVQTHLNFKNMLKVALVHHLQLRFDLLNSKSLFWTGKFHSLQVRQWSWTRSNNAQCPSGFSVLPGRQLMYLDGL